MPAPEPPANEPERLAALARYHILDTLPELQYDEIVELAAFICGTPIALISFVDAHRQWFKASVGVEARETPRDVSFCGHVVAQGSTMIVEDAKQDERFFDNPYVVGEPHVNFYAGAPLATDDGYTLGSLCVIDRQPRQLGVEQREALEALARVVVRQLESQLHEAELREARRAAEAANQAKSEFLAKMSHELRTPLNSVIGFTNLLRRNDKGKLDAKELMYLDKISRNGLHLLSLIDDLLDLSKIEAGHAQLELAPVELARLCAAVQDKLEGMISADGNVLRVAVPGGLAPIHADGRRLEQVLINLVGNANKFTKHGDIELCVVADPQRPSHAWRIDVIDSGIGIPAAQLDVVFEAFRQASEGGARTHGGTGLGLAISRSLAQLHGFELGVASVVGEGATFYLRLDPAAPIPNHRKPVHSTVTSRT